MNLLVLLQAAGGSAWSMPVMLLLMFAAMYFFMIRPQQKQQKKEREFRASLTAGSSVMTQSGLYGKVKELSDDYVMIEIAHGVVVKVNKNFIYPDGPMPENK